MPFAFMSPPAKSHPQQAGRATVATTRQRTRLAVERLEDRLVPSGYSPPTTGLVAWWAGDGNANDSIGGHNGTFVSGTYGPGILGTDQAFQLNGVNSYVQVANDPAWNLGSNDFTIDWWVNYSALRPDSISQPQSVFVGHDEGGGNSNKWFVAYGGGDLYWHMNSPATGPVFLALAPFSPNLNQWYNLAVTRAGSTFTIYVNGTPVSSATSSLPVPDANAPLTLGEAESPPGNFFMNGSMDDVLLYNRALSAAEIAGLSNSQTVTKLTASANPAVLGQPVTFTATVSSSLATPAGSVDFVDTTTGADLGSSPLSSSGKASVTVSNLAAGSHVIKAIYAGQGILQGSSTTLTEQVDYHFRGFLPPLNKTSVFPLGRNIRIKFRLTDYNGNPLSSLSDVQLLTANDVTLYNGATGASQDSADNRGLHYDADGHRFVFDWKTAGLTAGTYTITVKLADGTSHAVTVQLTSTVGCSGSTVCGWEDDDGNLNPGNSTCQSTSGQSPPITNSPVASEPHPWWGARPHNHRKH
jgi:hypothetical protein